MRWLAFLAGVALVVSAGAGLDVLGGGTGPASEGRVTRVIDGDTIEVGGESVRLIGIDTPETVRPGTPVECFGREASAYLRRLLEGRRVRLERDVEERDRYGRLLAYVHRLPDGPFVNAELARRGYASPATYPPNVRHAERFARLAAEARAAGRGLWSACR